MKALGKSYRLAMYRAAALQGIAARSHAADEGNSVAYSIAQEAEQIAQAMLNAEGGQSQTHWAFKEQPKKP